MSRPLAVIVGAGIAGLSTAWWLDQAGWDSIIIERASSLRENGYIITLCGLCLGTLERMGLRERLGTAACAFNENAFRDNKGRELLRLSYRDIMRDIPFINLRRSELVRVLADALPATASIRFNETVDEVIEHGDKVEVKLSSGDRVTADLLVGADGFRSVVRPYVANESLEPLGYRMAVYDIQSDLDLEPDCVSFTAPGHLDVFYRLPGERLVALNIWRDDNTEAETRPRDDRFALLQQVCRGSHSQVQDILEFAKEGGPTPVIDSLTLVNPPAWSKGRTVLIGDAAFCLTLLSGQGAGMTLVASEVLGDALKSSSNISHALSEYERKMRPAIARLQTRVRSMAAMYVPKSPAAFHARNLFLRVVPRSLLARFHRTAIENEISSTK
ncbi:uncharacterized protein BDV17DRAFT_104660 [Aspergillus undulatus]|uniref:uncharacterized protein n=1 Tax=Aspergillus undulatus TaxID=1810928 RepID=UPI003CCDE47D